MKLVFERGSAGERLDLISPCDVPQVSFEKAHIRKKQPRLPHVSENEISRHYTGLARCSRGVSSGFYPLGSCTMKYDPKINEETVVLKGFRGIHPPQPEAIVQGSMEVLYLAEKYLCEIAGMDAMTFQPVISAHGEFTGLLLIRTYYVHHNDTKRAKVIASDSTHGTDLASTSMCGYDVASIPSREDGYVDLEQLKVVVEEDVADLMLTNLSAVGLFDESILEIIKVVHDAGGLCYCDGASLNVVMGIARSGDMGLDVIHLSLYKILSTLHGGGGPGNGLVGYKETLKPFIPGVRVEKEEDTYHFVKAQGSLGDVKMLYGDFLVVVKVLSYILTLEKGGIPETAHSAVLGANYTRVRLSNTYDMVYNETCMCEFVMSLEEMKHDKDISAMNIAKALLDYDIHPPAMYFPLIVHEALMVEPTETEPRETPGETIGVFHKVYEQALTDSEALHSASHLALVGRPDEVTVTHRPILHYAWG